MAKKNAGRVTPSTGPRPSPYNTNDLSWTVSSNHTAGTWFTGTATFNFFKYHRESSDTFGDPPYSTFAILEPNRRDFVKALVSGTAGLAFDSGLAARAADLLKATADIDGQKVQLLFNTHFHFDHVGANEALGRAGARIVAHENVKKRLGMRIVSEAFNRTFEPLAPEGQPGETFAASGQITFGGRKVEYTHVPLAHTDGDAYLFLPGGNVLQTGDLGWNGLYPVIDYSSGGWIGGMIAGIDRLLRQAYNSLLQQKGR